MTPADLDELERMWKAMWKEVSDNGPSGAQLDFTVSAANHTPSLIALAREALEARGRETIGKQANAHSFEQMRRRQLPATEDDGA